MDFISSTKHNSGNEEVNTASVSTASTNVSPASANIRAASISQDTACAYIASQSNGLQIKFKDINQIDEDDIEEMDIKWNMALLSIRANRLWKKTGKNITIQGTDVAGFDKLKVECFNCHKIGHFARECKALRSQDRGRRDNYKQGSKVEEQALKGSSQNNIDDKGYWDSSCSRHMTGNISYLSDYEPFNGGYVSFGQGGCKITKKGTIKISKLKFENVYFVKDLKNFKLLDDTNVLHRTLRQHNMYSIDLNNIVLHKDLTCLVAKASADECMLWHRRLAHLNFKTMNRVLINKSHNKTPYELFNGRTPAIGFLKPCGCHVMILNTLDILGKLDAKGDEGYFIGYFMSSKAFRVFNKRTKRVEENLHVDLLENKAIEKGTNSTNLSGTNDAASQEVKKDVSSLRYIDLPNWVHDALLESSSSKPQDDCSTDVPESNGNSNRVRPIGTKRVLKNKKDNRGIVIRNKSRLVAQGHKQEERINYDEVFAHVARIEAIMLFLAYASFMGFTVYQMDVKSAFLYGTIDEEVYVMQPPGFQDLEYPARVYKVQKVIYGLHQAPRACSTEGGWHFSLSRQGKDRTRKEVDLHLYSSMIGSLMYLTASRPDIMFAVCAYARHQVTPKECHLHAVKRIFRYLKGHLKLGLWYPKESPFDLVAYSDSDYGGATQDRKSTTEWCQFLGRRLISWQCKK
nr:hypothetical protein [Tanacetum cinerariifolium]